MRTVLWIAYTGENYHGWQVQQNAPTVQGTLQATLEKLICAPVSLSGCSRTDAGVHASEYCCHFDTERCAVPPEKLPPALNTLLPYDIVVTRAYPAPDGFHARYSALGKQYLYRISSSPVRDPFLRGRSHHIKHPLDLPAMERAARHIEGTRDFSAFKAMGSNDEADPVRTVSEITVARTDNLIDIYITADGFLYNMARIIAGTLLYAGAGKISSDDIPGILSRRDRSAAGVTLPPQGLYLKKVYY